MSISPLHSLKLDGEFADAETFKKEVLLSVNTINTVRTTLDVSHKNARRVLMAFFMVKFPKEVLDDPFTPVYFYAKSVVATYKAQHDLAILREKVDLFLDYYETWMNKDRDNTGRQLLIQYFDLEGTLDKLRDSDSLQHLEDRMGVVRNRLNRFGWGDKIEEYRRYHPEADSHTLIEIVHSEMVSGFEYVGTPVEIIGKKAFWEYFVDVLRTNPQDRTIFSVIGEVCEKLKSLVPNRPDLHKHYAEHLDEEFVTQLRENDVASAETLNNLVRFTLTELKQLDSIHGAAQIDRWLRNWDLILKNCFEIHEVVPYCMRDIMNRVERVIEMVKIIREKSD